MLNILLVDLCASAYYDDFEGSFFPSMELSYLSSSLKKYGHNVRYYIVTNVSDFKSFLTNHVNFDFAVIANLKPYTYFAFMTPLIAELVRVSDEILNLRSKLIVADSANHLLDDIFCLAERNVHILQNCELPLEILNIINSSIGIEYSDELRFDSSNFPLPDLDIMNKLPRTKGVRANDKEKVLGHLQSSRGCEFSCAFCNISLKYGKEIRYRPLQQLKEEIYYYKANGVNDFIFWDETIFSCNNRFKDLLQLLEISDISWSCNARITDITKERLDLMKHAGCTSVLFGLERFTEKITLYTNKKLFIEHIKSVFDYMREIGIESVASIIVGLPDDTPDDIVFDKAILEYLRPNVLYPRVMIPLPGTKLYNSLVDEGKIKPCNEWIKISSDNTIRGYPILSEKLSKNDLIRIAEEFKNGV